MARSPPGPRSSAGTDRPGRPTRTASSLALLASEILATTGRSPSEHYADLVARHGEPAYARIGAPSGPRAEGPARRPLPDDVTATSLADEDHGKLTIAPGTGRRSAASRSSRRRPGSPLALGHRGRLQRSTPSPSADPTTWPRSGGGEGRRRRPPRGGRPRGTALAPGCGRRWSSSSEDPVVWAGRWLSASCRSPGLRPTGRLRGYGAARPGAASRLAVCSGGRACRDPTACVGPLVPASCGPLRLRPTSRLRGYGALRAGAASRLAVCAAKVEFVTYLVRHGLNVPAMFRRCSNACETAR